MSEKGIDPIGGIALAVGVAGIGIPILFPNNAVVGAVLVIVAALIVVGLVADRFRRRRVAPATPEHRLPAGPSVGPTLIVDGMVLTGPGAGHPEAESTKAFLDRTVTQLLRDGVALRRRLDELEVNPNTVKALFEDIFDWQARCLDATKGLDPVVGATFESVAGSIQPAYGSVPWMRETTNWPVYTRGRIDSWMAALRALTTSD